MTQLTPMGVGIWKLYHQCLQQTSGQKDQSFERKKGGMTGPLTIRKAIDLPSITRVTQSSAFEMVQGPLRPLVSFNLWWSSQEGLGMSQM